MCEPLQQAKGIHITSFLGSSDIYQLELDISSIHFFHHPLFSYEHILSSELEKYYLEYSSRDINAAEYYNEKVIGPGLVWGMCMPD